MWFLQHMEEYLVCNNFKYNMLQLYLEIRSEFSNSREKLELGIYAEYFGVWMD